MEPTNTHDNPSHPTVGLALVAGLAFLAGLEAIIDGATGVLAAQSLEETLQGMADALAPTVPYTSLAAYELDWAERMMTPPLATGSYAEQTLRPRLGLTAPPPTRPRAARPRARAHDRAR